MSKINGCFYIKQVKDAMMMLGPMNLQEIKATLELINVYLDETQVLEALDILVKKKYAKRNGFGLYNLN